MKYSKILILVLTLTAIISCENPLDKQPLGIISENVTWENESLVDLYVGNLYARCEFYPGGAGDAQSGVDLLVANSCAAGYCRTFGPWPQGYVFTQGLFTDQGTGGNGVMEYWKWDLVRDINVAIQKLENNDTESLPTDFKESKLGELHFLRAWVYFQMVMRYGGVPIILEPQSLDTPIDELSIPRSSEEAVYDLIADECDKAEELLGNKPMLYGQATSWAALALKSRAMMFAGSIGTFGTMQLDGLLGISNPEKFWTLSYNASKKIIAEGPFELYGLGAADPEKAYYDLFTRAERNSETILAEVYEGEGSKAEDWERWCAPALVNGTTFLNTFLETFEMYEYTDGTAGTLDRSTLVPGVFHDLADILTKKDPRCRANIFLPECTYMGKTVYMHEGMYVDGVYYTSNVPGIDVPAKGPARDIQRTGFFNKKRSNEDYDVNSVFDLGGTDYMIFRLGEIYLNLAEAAFALNKPDNEALNALNMVRNRVNMPDKTTIDWATIQKERKVELCFENQHYWDLRRWRIAEQWLDSDNIRYTGVKWRKDYSNPGMYEIILLTSGNATDAWDRNFEEKNYYFPIGLARRQKSPALIENPGYSE